MSKNSTSDKDRKLNVYENNYLLIKLVPKYDQEKMALAIMDYFFTDEADTNFKDERSNVIWVNIKMVLDKSKTQSKNALKRWEEDAKSDTWHNAKDDTKENAKVNAIYFLISNFIFLKDRGLLREKIEEWIKYKTERKEYYKETGFKSLLTRIKNYTEKYGEEKVIDLINECMASNYKGIIFEKLEKGQATSKRVAPVPDWLNKDVPEGKELSEEEVKAFEERLKSLR